MSNTKKNEKVCVAYITTCCCETLCKRWSQTFK